MMKGQKDPYQGNEVIIDEVWVRARGPRVFAVCFSQLEGWTPNMEPLWKLSFGGQETPCVHGFMLVIVHGAR